ncbi:phosphopantothenoylcysteine decarboxylase [Streptococcus oralis SK313]|uniref:Phosphopantothenoylcysteine decarboxylase n=1 Tax=Streptococcus oralis SK313 TaxID=1035190 RepID=F9Q113_STROR|nr:phosphopantothenoylcysteine decarboxylase [Streptococcus oralis SK313]
MKRFNPIIHRKESYGKHSLGCNWVNRLLQVGRFSQFSKKQGHQVTVLMTQAATEFIQPLTLQVLSQNPVHLDVMKEPYPDQVNHIQLGKETDLFIVAPATANTIAKLAHGFADNMVTSTALSLPQNIPKLLAPAMNTKMYDHPATQTNLKTLETYGYKLISPKESLLACGDYGRGALADLDIILERIKETLNEKRSNIAPIAIFFATMLVIHFLSSLLFNLFPFPIKPTIVHVPVIIASIIYGPRVGVTLGFLMGLLSLTVNTITILPTSYLFSPFVPNGNIYSVIIAIVPRILIGLTPYLVYKLMKNKTGLILAGALGSLTNTVFVLGGIFYLFGNVFDGNIQKLLATVISTNSIAELVISAILTVMIVPRLETLKK